MASRASVVREVDGLYEMTTTMENSQLYNEDLAPTPIAGRTWGFYDMASVWVGMAVCVPTWMLGASMIAAGFTWWVAVLTVMLGNLIVLVPMILNSFAGTKYGIPFPVFLRASFGVYGSVLPSILRTGVACGWFGIQTYLGGTAIDGLLNALGGGWSTIPAHEWIAFGVFWLMNVAVIWYSPVGKAQPGIKLLADWSAPILILIGIGLLVWAVSNAGGLGPMFAAPMKADWSLWPPFLTAMVAYWATLALCISDLTRYCKSQSVQVWGQIAGMPTTMTFYSFLGVAVTSCTLVIFGEAVWDPIQVTIKTGNALFIIIGLIFFILATLTTNVAANVVAPAYGFSNLAPKYISWRTGAMITAVIGIVMMPWRLMETYGAYIFDWLGNYGGFLGPIAGIMVADYWICRRGRLKLEDLYKAEGQYRYWSGWNPAGLIALVVAVIVAFLPLDFNRDWRWFVGAIVAGLVSGVVYEFYVVREFKGEAEAIGRVPTR